MITVTFQPNYGDEGLFIVTRPGSNLFGRIGSTARSTVFHCPSVATFFKFTDVGGSDITNVAQKPMALMDAFLRWTQPGDVIADFGAGSGSLLSAAICGRHGGRSGIVKLSYVCIHGYVTRVFDIIIILFPVLCLENNADQFALMTARVQHLEKANWKDRPSLVDELKPVTFPPLVPAVQPDWNIAIKQTGEVYNNFDVTFSDRKRIFIYMITV